MSEINFSSVEEKKVIVSCPKCSASLNVRLGNYAYVCPVCNQLFRTRVGERLVKDISAKKGSEAYLSVGKDAEGNVVTDSIVK